jgi:hypothetical protein
MSSTAALAKLKGFFTVTATGDETLGRKRSLQAERRRSEIWTDQHEREWAAEMDLKTGHPCTPLVPLGWKAPVLPPPQFLRFGSGRGRPIVTIDYRAWEEHQGRLQATWEEEVRYQAARMFPNSWAREVQARNPLIMQEAGPPPYDVTFVRACADGSRWALGLSKVEPKWLTDDLKASLPKPRNLMPSQSKVSFFDDAEPSEAEDIADRMARASRFEDMDDDNEPTAAPVPVRRGPGRPRKARED